MLAFFALTRTQVGRDGLRLQLMRTFAADYEGRLEIDRLSGNLVNDLFAGGVRIYDADGQLVLSADSVVAEPSWRDLLRRRVTLGSLTLYRPEINLTKGSNGTWNLASTFQPTRMGNGGGGANDPWSFTTLSLRIIDGGLQTRNEHGVPDLVAQGRLFDFTNSVASDLDLRATVDWQREARIVEVQSASAHLSSLGLPLTMLEGQIVLDDDVVSVPSIDFEVGSSRGKLSGGISGLVALRRAAYDDVAVQLNLVEAELDHDELQHVFPSSPFREQTSISLRLQGPVSALVLEEFQVAHGSSAVRVEGTLQGLPGRADFDAAVRDARVRLRDLQALLPGVDLQGVRHLREVGLSADVRGILAFIDGPELELFSGSWSATTGAGRASGTFQAAAGEAHRFGYTAALETDGVDPGQLLNDPALRGRIVGRISATGEADDWATHDATVVARLASSSLAGRSVDSLHAEVRVAGRDVNGVAFIRQHASDIRARLVARLDDAPRYDLAVQARELDAGPLLLNDSLRTRLNGTIRISGGGHTWDTFRGDVSLTLDSSHVALGQRARAVAPQHTTARISDGPDGGSRLVVGGDVVEASLSGSTNPKVMTRAATLWTRLLGQIVYRDVLQPYPKALQPDLASDETLNQALARELSEERLRLIAQHRPTGNVRFGGELRVLDASAISALFPSLPPMATDLELRFDMASDDNEIRGSMEINADSMQVGPLALRELQAGADVTGRLGIGADEAVDLQLDLGARRLAYGDRRFEQFALNLALDDGTGSLHLRSGDTTHELVEMDARLDALGTFTRLTLEHFRYATGGYAWVNASQDSVDLYDRAAVFQNLQLTLEDDGGGVQQQIQIRGAVSAVPGDTLVLVARNIALHQLVQALQGPRMGGEVNGRIAVTGGLLQPELTGSVNVRHLQFDNRLLGDLRLQSSYIPGMPDVQLDAHLQPATGPVPEVAVDGRPLLVEENALRLGGRFRMPEFDERGRSVRPSALDLTLEAERADAFFFEYIFRELSDVQGAISGSGRITGSLNDPEFDVDVHLADAAFVVPDYNLHFQATADAHVDRDGIHIRNGFVTDKTGGTGRIAGDVLFNDYRYFSLNLAARLNEVQIMDVTDPRRGLSFYGRIWASGNATLTGPLSDAALRSADVSTSPRSEVFIPLTEGAAVNDPGFILFADSAGNVPDFSRFTQRDNILARRPVGERPFVDALEMDLNIFAPPGSTVHLVIDPLLGDMINAVGTGRVQLVRREGEYYTYGALDVSAGDYLFTAGDVFMRRFLIDEGSIRWDGDPTDAQLDIWASYRTRASSAGLPGLAVDTESAPLIPLEVRLHITARVSSPNVDLSLALERRDRDVTAQGLEAILNDPERSTQYATSVLLTNTFLLTTDQFSDGDAGGSGTRNQFAFNSVSQLVASQINRYLSYALPNVDVNFGLQGERAQDLDVTYGVALRLMDERLIIRGEGVYQNDRQNPTRGEFLVQVRLTPGVSVEVFYRREGDILSDQTLTNTTGAGVSYQTRFSNWDGLVRRLFGRTDEEADEAEEDEEAYAPF